MSDSINSISERCVFVGKELASFVSKLKVVNERTFSRSLNTYKIGLNQQKHLRLKCHFDANQRSVGVYFKMRTANSDEAVSYFKLLDNDAVITFDASDNDLKRLFYFPSELNGNTSTLLVTDNFHDCILIYRLIVELEIFNVSVCCVLNVDEQLVHEQAAAIKSDLKNVVLINQNELSLPGLLSLHINIKSLFEISVDNAKGQFVKKLISTLKSKDE